MTLPAGQMPTAPQEKASEETARQVNDLLDSPEFAMAIETKEFKLFLDYLPMGVVISKRLRGDHRIVFANKAYDMTGQRIAERRGRDWSILEAFHRRGRPQRHDDAGSVPVGGLSGNISIRAAREVETAPGEGTRSDD